MGGFLIRARLPTEVEKKGTRAGAGLIIGFICRQAVENEASAQQQAQQKLVTRDRVSLRDPEGHPFITELGY